MADVNSATLDCLKAWLASRPQPKAEDRATIGAPENLRSIGFPDLTLEKAGPQHQDTVINCVDFHAQKPKAWTELSHLVDWSSNFVDALKSNKTSLATLELLRGANEYPISLARFHVDESIDVVQSALTFEYGFDIQHPDTRGNNYAVSNIMIEDSTSLHDIVRQSFASLYSKCAVRLVVKTNGYYSAITTAYLVDLMHSSGATESEICCLAFERRESIGNERFCKPLSPSRQSKLSVIAAVFKQTDTFAAAQGIIEAYFRDRYPNLIILVEESIYERFIQDWQRYYSHALHIGSRLDEKTTVVDTFNSKVQVDLAAIDIKASHKMSGDVINVLKFRTPSELMNLLGHLRKIPYMSIWNNDVLLASEFTMRLNFCNDFWIDHIPASLTSVRFSEDVMSFYYETVIDDMTYIFNSVYAQFSEEAETLRKTQAAFMKKSDSLKCRLIMQAFISIVSKLKSLRNGSTVHESVARLKRFQRANLVHVFKPDASGSKVEIHHKPVGLAILLVREDASIKNKSALLEMIFKNLLLGNAVLLVCPANTLGAKFAMDNDHIIPFKMVHEALPDISRLSLDASIEQSESSFVKKQCPKNTYAIEILPEMSSEQFEAITMALGSRRKSIWLPDVMQTNYWNDE